MMDVVFANDQNANAARLQSNLHAELYVFVR